MSTNNKLKNYKSIGLSWLLCHDIYQETMISPIIFINKKCDGNHISNYYRYQRLYYLLKSPSSKFTCHSNIHLTYVSASPCLLSSVAVLPRLSLSLSLSFQLPLHIFILCIYLQYPNPNPLLHSSSFLLCSTNM